MGNDQCPESAWLNCAGGKCCSQTATPALAQGKENSCALIQLHCKIHNNNNTLICKPLIQWNISQQPPGHHHLQTTISPGFMPKFPHWKANSSSASMAFVKGPVEVRRSSQMGGHVLCRCDHCSRLYGRKSLHPWPGSSSFLKEQQRLRRKPAI